MKIISSSRNNKYSYLLLLITLLIKFTKYLFSYNLYLYQYNNTKPNICISCFVHQFHISNKQLHLERKLWGHFHPNVYVNQLCMLLITNNFIMTIILPRLSVYKQTGSMSTVNTITM